jgi:hypothetical protein
MPRKQAETRSMGITNATEYQPSNNTSLLRAGAIDLLGPSTALSLHDQNGIWTRMSNKVSVVKSTGYVRTGKSRKVRGCNGSPDRAPYLAHP